MKFILSIELEDAMYVSVIAHLAKIVANEGQVISDSNALIWFLHDVEDGLGTRNGKRPFIIGDDEIGEWLTVADSCESIAELIRGYAVEFASTTDTPESD